MLNRDQHLAIENLVNKSIFIGKTLFSGRYWSLGTNISIATSSLFLVSDGIII